MSNTYFKAMSVMGCEIGGITRRSLCRHNCCDGENCVTWLEKQFAKLNEYEEAKADGRLVVLPCKVGDRVYSIYGYLNKSIQEDTVKHICVQNGEIRLTMDNTCTKIWGRSAFATREEAEKALEVGKP